MDKRELEDSLRDLDRQLSSSHDLVVVGGAAMILHFGSSRATRDIDVLALRGDRSELRRAVEAVARARDLPVNWMGDAVKGFADILPPDFCHRLIPLDLNLRHLRVYVLGRPDLVAMKVVALREQDLEDLELLLPQMSEADRMTLAGIGDHVAHFRSDWAQKIRYFMLERGWQIE